MGATTKKPVTKKPAVKKPTAKKAVTKKAAANKVAVKKTAAKKATVKKTAAKRPAVKKAAVKKPSFDHDEVGRISEKNLQAIAMDIDRQMKMLAEMDTRVVIAKDQLAEFQEMISAKINSFQNNKGTGDKAGSTKDIMKSIRATKDEAAKIIRDSKALHETYDLVVKHFEKGRVAAVKEMKKAEVVFKEKLHVVEAKVLKKAGEIKKEFKK